MASSLNFGSEFSHMHYFDRQYAQDKLEIESIDKLMHGVWETLAKCQSSTGVWPYEIMNGEAVSANSLSVSTQAMIHYALDVASGRIPFHEFAIRKRNTNRTPNSPPLSAASKTVREALDRSLKVLGARTNLADEIASGTFGPLNPFTLAWLLPISSESDDLFQEVLGLAKRSLQKAERRSDGSISVLFLSQQFDITTHAFPVLRALQLKKMICDCDSMATAVIPKIFNEDSLGEWFYSRLLDHIAFATIKDGPFDAAELAFSLEGYLLCRPQVQDGCNHDRDAIEKAFQILESRQEITPYWRPLKPLLTNSRGFALLPLSVEIVNSLFRSCWLLGTRGDALFGKHRDIFRTYYEWIESRVTEGKYSNNDGGLAEKRFQGWYSEHLSNKDGIHTWETSQVGIYLVHYRSMLQRDVAAKCVEAAGLRRQRLSRQTDPDLKPDATPINYWEFLKNKYSPRPDDDSDAFKVINDHFVKPRDLTASVSGGVLGTKRYSMLLYGPPGTGKTGLAEGLAQALQWDFISLSPSDFVHSGVSQVEQRAKQIFDALGEQENCIILLDEIDRLILDRSHSDYSRQDDMFQLMTPSMLPKLKTLRSKQGCIFIIATNYLERIEPAAVRVGRVDEQLLVGLPNLKSRCSILKKEIKSALRSIEGFVGRRREEAKRAIEEAKASFGPDQGAAKQSQKMFAQLTDFLDNGDGFLNGEHIRQCAAVTPLASYSELKQLSEDVAVRFAEESEFTAERFVSRFQTSSRELAFDVRLASYFKRVEKTEDKPPIAELIDNAWLTVESTEVNTQLKTQERDELKKLLQSLVKSIKRSKKDIREQELLVWLKTGPGFPDDLKRKMARIAEALGEK